MSHFIESEPRVPEPALIRGFILALTALLANVLQREIDVSQWLDLALNIYTWVAPLIAAYLIRRKVTPTKTAELRVQKALYTESPVSK